MGDTYENETEADADRARQKALRSTRVELEPIGLTEHGRRYRVIYAASRLLALFDRRSRIVGCL
jgi:hypothetical protein